MYIRTVALAALVAAAPAVAAEAAPAPRWSIGGGLGAIGEFLLVSPRQGDLFLLTDRTSIPVATVFLERRLGERSWLVLGAAGNLLRESFDAPPDEELGTFGTVVESAQERGSLLVGVRRVITRPGAIVDVSLVASAEGGYGRIREERVRSGLPGTPERTEIEDRGVFASVAGGIAVERSLTGGLALRISTNLADFSWSALEREEGGVTREGSATGVTIAIAPRIELRLAF